MNFELLTLAIHDAYIITIVDITERLHTKIVYKGRIKDLYDDVELFEEVKSKNVLRICPDDCGLRITVTG